MVNRKYLKLAAKFFCPYKVFERVSVVAYKLELPLEAKIHPIFHVSQLRLHGGSIIQRTYLPLLNEDGLLAKEPISILDRRIGKRNGRAVTKWLIH